MVFQNPAALLWLIPLAGTILALYLLKMRRRDMQVPALFLWPERVEEVRANALFQRLRITLLLLLQLLAVAWAVFALARPQTQQKGLAGEITVLVLDVSASMQATDVKPSRFEEARRRIADAIRRSNAGDRIALIEAASSPKVVFPLTSDPAMQLRALDSVEGTDAEADVGEALRLAAALVASEPSARIVLLSDGAIAPIRDFPLGDAKLDFQRIGESSRNMSVAALGITDTGNGLLAYVAVKNHGLDRSQSSLSIRADGKLLDSVRVTVDGGKTVGRTLPVPAGTVKLEAALASGDMLPSDDRLVTLAGRSGGIKALLVGAGDPFLERALALDPRVTLDRARELPDSEKRTRGKRSGYDLIIFEGTAPLPVGSAAVMSFGPPGESSPVRARGKSTRPQFVSAERTPLLQGVDLTDVFLDEVHTVTPKAGAAVLAETTAGPLIVFQEGTQPHLYIGLEPLKSDWPLKVGFPIFMANALDLLAGQAPAKGPLVVQTGRALSLNVEPGARAKLIDPSGRATELETASGRVTHRPLRSAGRYRIESAGSVRELEAVMRSDRESTIQPEDMLPVAGKEVKATISPVRFADFWKPLALLALLVLALEWWVFARRS